MIEVTEQGKVLYKTEHNQLAHFPEAASNDLVWPRTEAQLPRVDPLDFLADEA